MAEDRFHILWFPTMRCNLRCRYCHFYMELDGRAFVAYGKARTLGEELHWLAWVGWFSRLRPYSLEITGGEPTLYRGLGQFLAHLPVGSYWAITSNSLRPECRALPLQKCTDWTASWHGKRPQEFTDNLTHIAKSGVRPSVSVVVGPDDLQRAEDAIATWGDWARVNILRELNPGVEWDGMHKAQWEKLQALAAAHPGVNLVTDDIPPRYEFPRYDFCDAGHRYICVMPDGEVYRCYSDAMLRPESGLGHIKDFEPLEPGTPCGNECAGCATDFRQRKWNDD